MYIYLDLVQLIGGDGYKSGNVFVQNSLGYFGPVCDDNWGFEDARVVCGQLGFSRDNVTVWHYSEFGSVPNDFAMDQIYCDGTEAKIQDCVYSTSEDCRPGEGAGVVCFEL